MKPTKIIQVIGAMVGWFAVTAQFYLIIANRTASIPETVIRFFSFYTILTNILVALCFTYPLLMSRSGGAKFFTRYSNLTAITLYILVVGIVYNLILRFLWQPQGMQKLVDELLHTFIPLLFFTYWLTFTPKVSTDWRKAFAWLVYPLVYLIFILIRGAFSGFYPYPFINAQTLGYSMVLINIIYLVFTFLVIAFILIFTARRIVQN